MNAHTFAGVAHLNQNPKPDFPNIFCVLSLVGNSKWAPTAPVLDAPLRPSCGQPCPDGPSPPSNPHQTPPQNVFRAPIKIYFLHNIEHCCTNFTLLEYFLALLSSRGSQLARDKPMQPIKLDQVHLACRVGPNYGCNPEFLSKKKKSEKKRRKKGERKREKMFAEEKSDRSVPDVSNEYSFTT